MLKLKINSYEGKTIDDALNKALGELNASKEEVYYKDEEQVSGGLFKSKKYVVKVMLKEDVLEYIKAYLKEVTELMGIKVELETLKKETYIKVNMLSDNSSILIGKNGRTMSSLQNLLRQAIYSKSGIKVNVILDANEYKEKQEKNIERLAVKLAKDVVKTGIEVKMDRMNSYERRLVHNRLSNFKGVTTISEGEEPNRCVVIKPVEK
ncbi:MAG TPA: KH domain-containing protein [Candidatus Aphodocola excrementigallinarum]|mgnify:CR=1 FL=1|uniref:KH domain-containing protein n=1 Tax=Candidatus Aphodocola excrementigallinarum TaxID=2840670 RepID=A0A9D1LGP5_9FIRM|nr:KH domain-containing protein [Candidatus Aphodocola excrementigallinarum]